MFDIFIQQSILQKIIINTLLVSIPEELYMVMFTLIMVGEFEYWKEPECKRLINRFDYVRVFLPTIVGALISNIIINVGLNYGVYHFITPLVIYIFIVLTNDVLGDASAVKWMFKALIFFMIAYLSIGIFEIAYIPLILYGTGMTMSNISDNLLIYFIISLPTRVFQFSLLSFIISRKRTQMKGLLIRNILSQPTLAVILFLLIFFNIIFLQIMCKAIIFDKVLIEISRISQALIIACTVMFPMLNISAFLLGYYMIQNKETKDRKSASKELQNLIIKMNEYNNCGKFDNIKWKLNEFGEDIGAIAISIYKESEPAHNEKIKGGR